MVAPNNQVQQMIECLNDILKKDKELREKYGIGNKFRFIHDRLQTLLETLQQHKPKHVSADILTPLQHETDVCVYIYLYNAQGIMLRSWQNMLTPRLLYEFGFNRPIYSDKAIIETFLRSKSNKIQHAYLTVAVKPENILPPGETPLKDPLGNPLIRIKEGALFFEKIQSLTHNGQEYAISAEGELIKK